MKTALQLLFLLTSFHCFSQVAITDPAEIYTQDFNSLSTVGLDNSYATLPFGWTSKEYGSNANMEYRADFGSLAGGDLYSYGAELGSDSTERALGSVGSGSNYNIHYGISFVNESSDTINSITLSYTGELWRVGNADRSTFNDTLHFSFSVNADSIDNPGFTAFSELSFVSPANPGDPRNQINVDGNASEQQVFIEQTIDVTVAPNDTLWLKWFDFNSSSFDDGLAIDDLALTFHTESMVDSPYGEISEFDTYYNEDFNSLGGVYGESYLFSTLPQAWFAHENGANANDTYSALNGTSGGGNIYSFGDSLGTDRSLGSIGSGTLNNSIYGSAWINRTGEVVNNVEVNFTGEMWRQGRPFRATGPDTLFFSYAVNAASISEGNFLGYDLLNFFSPVEDGVLNMPTNGNDEMYSTEKSAVIGGLALQPNDTLWIRWSDYNSASFDDGLSIDDFSIAALTTANVLQVAFQDENTYLNENAGIVGVPIVIENGNGFLTQVNVEIESLGTIELGTDINIVPSTVSFTEGLANDTSYFYFEILNSDPFEEDEYFVLKLTNPSNAFLGEAIYDTIHIANYAYPLTDIADLRSVDEEGVADSIGTNVLIEGIVHGLNFATSGGVDFYVIDGEFGINVYRSDENSGYEVQEGDEVKVWGQVSQFRGLTRIENLDSIEVVSTGNALSTPLDLNQTTEVNESSYLVIDSLQLVPAINSWPPNFPVQAINIATDDTLTIFISSNSELSGELAPTGPFKLIGIGSQKSSSTLAPFNDGYRVMALTVEEETTVSVSNAGKNQFRAYPNPVSNELTLIGELTGSTVRIMNITGQVVLTNNAVSTNLLKLDVANLNSGIYLVTITIGDSVQTVKIIKQ